MQAIRKKISLEPFTSRQKSTIPFIGAVEGESYPSLNWGKYPYSVDFDVLSRDQDAINSYGIGIKYLGKMTFAELMEGYHAVKGMKVSFPEDDASLTSEQKREIEKLKSIVLFVDSKKVIDQSTINPDPCCNPCFIPSPDEPMDLDSGDYYYYDDVAAYMNVCLVQSSNIIGAYTFAVKDWMPGVRYFEGDKVIYDGKTFKLKPFGGTTRFSGSTVNCMGEAAMVANLLVSDSITGFTGYDGLSDSMFDDFIVASTSDIVDFGYVYAKIRNDDSYTYYIRPSWGGYFDGYDGITYFDELKNPSFPEYGFISPGEYETNHWIVDGNIFSHGEYHVTSCGDDVHISSSQDRHIGYDDVTIGGLEWETKLSNFVRRSKTVTDDGKELPGKLNSSDSEVLDLIYMIGTTKNVDTTCDVAIGDFLADIQVIPDTTGGISIFITEEHAEEVHTETGSYIQYTYPNTSTYIGPSEWFMGSVEKTPDGEFIIYDEYSNEVFRTSTGVPANNYEIFISTAGTGGANIVTYDTINNDNERGKKTKLENSFNVNFPVGRKSLNGDGSGFRIQPTGGTQDSFDVVAPGLLAQYGGSGQFVTYQNMDTYGKLVRNWGPAGETGKVILTYYVGAEVELCEQASGDTDYCYNGGEKRLIYRDTYSFVARERTDVVDGVSRTYTYLELDYESNKEGVVYENIGDYEDMVTKSDITMATNTMTEGGEPVSVNFQNSEYFMEDYKLGISFVSNNNENVYIDRGNATAFERHMRLSEVGTLEDLETMGNGSFFRMKS